jgi:hypothetical protein
MNLISKLTVTPLLYACGALLVAVVGLAIALKVAGGKVDTAQAHQATAESRRDTAITERDAWKAKTADLRAANTAVVAANDSLRAELARQQQQCSDNAAANQRAIAAARADAADADRTLKAFTAKFQIESRKPTCARALDALGAACPALEGY